LAESAGFVKWKNNSTPASDAVASAKSHAGRRDRVDDSSQDHEDDGNE
jgi:hypothetical protein